MIQLYHKYGSYLDTHIFVIWDKLSVIFSEMSFSLECIIAKVFQEYGSFYPNRIVVTSIGPLIVILVILGITQILFKKKAIQKQLKESLNTQLLLMIGLFYSCIALNKLLECLHSIQIEGKKFSLADTSIEVSDENYQLFLSSYISVFVVFWSLIVPVLILFRLLKMRNSLFKISVNLNYGLLFQEYKHKYYYWEFVKLSVRNFIFFFVNLSGSDQLTEDGILIIVTLTLYTWVMMIIMPYQRRSHNYVDIAISCLSITTAFLTTFGYDIEDKEKGLYRMCEILIDISNLALVIFIIHSMRILPYYRRRSKAQFVHSWRTLKLWMYLRKKILRYNKLQNTMKKSSFDYLPIFENMQNVTPIQSFTQNGYKQSEEQEEKFTLGQPFLNNFDGQL